MKKLPGILVRSPKSIFGDKVYYVNRGMRHWVRDASWLKVNGFEWPTDVLDISESVICNFLNSGHAPLSDISKINDKGISSVDLREIAASNLRGTGIEFGAGASPFPVPLDCNVLFADAFTYEYLKNGMYPGQNIFDLICPDYVTDIQTLFGICGESLDFVIACHVIEHTTNPIAAIHSAYRALKKGGSLVLVVPDMEKSFDSKRDLTPLTHLIDDFKSPSRDRDHIHYREFYSKAFVPPENVEFDDFIQSKHDEDYSIHFHTWNYQSFSEMIQWINHETPWSKIWSHPTLSGEDNIEFYFVLTK